MTGAKSQRVTFYLMRRWPDKTRQRRIRLICKCRMQRDALFDIHTLKFAITGSLAGGKSSALRPTSDITHRVALLYPTAPLPSFRPAKPQSYMPVREFIFQFFK